MKFTSCLILVALLALTACAAPSKILINERGKQVRCASFGIGWLGTPIALATYAECVKQQEAAGFVAFEDWEKREGPKVESRSGVEAIRAARPIWEIGDSWTYRLSGPGTVNGIVPHEVVGKELAVL